MAANRYSVVFFAALLVAAGATYAVYKTVRDGENSARIATSPVVIAAKDMPEGTVIERLALAVTQWPSTTVPPGTFSSVDSVAGRVARVPIFNGEPIVPGRLAPVGTGPGLEVKITPGKRAMSLRVNDVSSIAGLIQPNSRVDIMLTLNQSEEVQKRSAITFMPNVRILAMGTQSQRGEDGRPIVTTVATIEATNEEVEQLLVAQTLGQIQMVLRGYGDPDSVASAGATTTDVAEILRSAMSRPAGPPPNPTRRASNTPRRGADPSPAPVPPVVTLPPAKPAVPDSLSVRVFRGRTAVEEKKFAKDSIRRDTIR